MLYQESHRNLLAAQEEINRWRSAVEESDLERKNLHDTKAKLLLQLREMNENLSTLKETNHNLIHKIEKKDKDLEKLVASEEKFKLEKKELVQYVNSSEDKIKELNKNKKMLEKEVHNLNIKLENCRDTILNLKAEISTQKIRNPKFE